MSTTSPLSPYCPATFVDRSRYAAWKRHTNAEIVSEALFAQLKYRMRWCVVGVIGFARPWSQLSLQGDRLVQTIADARASIFHELASRQRSYGQRLLVASGATSQGVLQLVYETCELLEITAFGVAPDQALSYPLGMMHYVLPFGNRFGDESDIFIGAIDELIILGGGPQSKREVLAAAEAKLPITVIQGFGGTADQLSPSQLPHARFVQRVSASRC